MSAPAIARAPGGFPVLGHALKMRNDPLSFFESLRGQGDIVEIKLGPQRAYVATTPELVREILVVKPREFDKGAQFEAIRALLGNGLANSDGETHRRHRLLMQPAFRNGRIAEYAKLMSDEIVEGIDDWQDGQELDVRNAMNALTIAVACRAMMSSDAADDLVRELQHGMPFVLDVMYRRMVNPLVKAMAKLPTTENREFTATLARLHRLAGELVANYRRDTGSQRNDLLTMLLMAKESETGEALSDQELHDQIITVLAAGTETTAATMSWVFHLLSQHPDVEKRLHAEIDEVLRGRPAGYEDLKQLTYTAQVVSEALRYYPPAWLLSRRAKRDLVVKGYRIPAGTSVMLSPWLIHRDPKLYREPDRFDPDRWSPDRAGEIPREAIVQFGAGPRKCIGDVFAVVEASLAIATIAGRWRFRPAGPDVEPLAGIALWPRRLVMKLERRGS